MKVNLYGNPMNIFSYDSNIIYFIWLSYDMLHMSIIWMDFHMIIIWFSYVKDFIWVSYVAIFPYELSYTHMYYTHTKYTFKYWDSTHCLLHHLAWIITDILFMWPNLESLSDISSSVFTIISKRNYCIIRSNSHKHHI